MKYPMTDHVSIAHLVIVICPPPGRLTKRFLTDQTLIARMHDAFKRSAGPCQVFMPSDLFLLIGLARISHHHS